MFSLSIENHHMNRTPAVETCCERKIYVKSFVKLQFCQEEVGEIEEEKRLDLLIMENVLTKVKLDRKCLQAFDSKRNWKTRCQKLR